MTASSFHITPILPELDFLTGKMKKVSICKLITQITEMPNAAFSEGHLKQLSALGNQYFCSIGKVGAVDCFILFQTAYPIRCCYCPKSNGKNLHTRCAAHFENPYQDFFVPQKLPFLLIIFFLQTQLFNLVQNLVLFNDPR